MNKILIRQAIVINLSAMGWEIINSNQKKPPKSRIRN